jgi:hypothetical protein
MAPHPTYYSADSPSLTRRFFANPFGFVLAMGFAWFRILEHLRCLDYSGGGTVNPLY